MQEDPNYVLKEEALCLEDSITSPEECKTAAANVGLDHEVIEIDSFTDPLGCYIGRKNDEKYIYFNTAPVVDEESYRNVDGHKSNLYYKSICRKGADDLHGAVGDGRLFDRNTVDFIGRLWNIVDKNSCCKSCKKHFPDTLMVNYINGVYEEYNCVCLKRLEHRAVPMYPAPYVPPPPQMSHPPQKYKRSIQKETPMELEPVTGIKRIFNGVIGNKSVDEDMELGEGWSLDSENLFRQSRSLASNEVDCYEGCKSLNPESRFFEFTENMYFGACKCFKTITGKQPKSSAAIFFSATCANV